MKQNFNCFKIFLMILAIQCVLFFLTGCGSGENSAATVYTSSGDFHTPVAARLVHGTLFVVSAEVNGSTNLDMLVDTGATKTQVPAGIFGNTGGDVFISSLCLENGICFQNILAWSNDSAFTQSKDGYFNGIIGVDLLRNFDLTLDYQNGLIYFYDTLEKGFPGLVTIPIHYETGRPSTYISMEGVPQGTNLLDTGAAYTKITPAMLDTLSRKPDVLFKSVNFTINGSERVEYVLLTGYCAGVACPDEITVQVGDWPAIGGTFFREFLTIFKFSEGVVKLDRYEDRSHIKASGIQRTGLQINIYDASDIIYVNEGSFAWEQGLREGDEIISVNGLPIDVLGYFGIYELLADISIDEYQFLVVTTDGDTREFTIFIPS